MIQTAFLPIARDIRRCSDPECGGHDLDVIYADESIDVDEYALLSNARSREEIHATTAAIGLANGYPPCCVEEFVGDERNHRSPGKTRTAEFPVLQRCRTASSDIPQYVPCRSCAQALSEKIQQRETKAS